MPTLDHTADPAHMDGGRSTAGDDAAARDHADGAPAWHPSRWRRWAALVSLAVGIFTLVTIEELPIGVLTLIADDLEVSEGMVGLAVTFPGVLAAGIALLAPAATARLDRRTVLLAALGAVIVSCVLSVLSTGIWSLLASRVFTGIAIGLYWPTLPIVAVRQVPPQRAAVALSIALSGAAGAVVLGVPFTAWIGAMLGWRASFVVVGVMAAVVLTAIVVLVRPVRAQEPSRLSDLVGAFRRRGVRYAVAMAVLIVTGQFTTYSYVSPLLQGGAGISLEQLPIMLLVFGLAGMVGNFASTPLLNRSPGSTVALVATGMAGSLLLILLLAHSFAVTLVLMTTWGLFAGSVSVVMQSFVTRYAGRYEESATALNSATFNLSIALGALFGGLIIDAVGLTSLAVVSIVMIALGGALAVRWLLTGGPREDAEA